ncbi:MAG TPA: trypsin-like peptidase domain-containing protein [Candidatus Sumerlaeota bacterium]|nr:trypsin-like peptidase domain-containing protein [Candidatus Sumerlaeota bacterium]HOR26417.1 trypsin-like peptidase domain-containing protein [Candidatus Sumerlaeota bacterium]HPK01883.1 trypsin-like peptidase domain-containing protein [Candidatus Sumerlaeota bacterium]
MRRFCWKPAAPFRLGLVLALAAAAATLAAQPSDSPSSPSLDQLSEKQVEALPEGPADFQQIIERAKRRVFPALVFVKPIVEDYGSGEKKKQEVFGSGVIISPDGLVITNNHVVENAIKVNCVLFDKDQLPAEILGRDPDTDLALLQLDAPAEKRPLPAAEFADSDAVDEGDFVMALGSPFGFTRSISLGIISNTQRYLGFENEYRYNLWLQTDAAINPGNSGGPLVDIEGRIVGINTLGLRLVAENVGFSIPANVVREIAARLERDGAVSRAWTGLRLQPLKDFNTNTFTQAERGVLIANVESGSPAEAAGLQSGDLLVAVGDHPIDGAYVENLPAIHWRLADLPTDAPTTFTLVRNGRTIAAAVQPVLKGKVEGENLDLRRWNMTLKEINKYKEPQLYFYRKEGIYVQGVRNPGNASAAGIQRNDILLSIERQPVDSLATARQLYESILGDETREKKVLLEVLRGGLPKLIVLDYTKDYEKAD